MSMTNEPGIRTYQVTVGDQFVDLTVEERGEGRPFLLLHGGAGPASMARFAVLLADRLHARVFVPTHPGSRRSRLPSWSSRATVIG